MNDALKDEMEREMRDLCEDFKKEKAARIAAESKLDGCIRRLDIVQESDGCMVDNIDRLNFEVSELKNTNQMLVGRLSSAEMFVREIVAWFDVMHSKYVVDGTPVEMSEEWPTDWLRRVRPSISGCGVEKPSPIVRERPPIEPDADGDCKRCGLRWSIEEIEGTDKHECPPGFTA